MKIIDFHTHAFPDSMAARAIQVLEAETDEARTVIDGRVSTLLASMDTAGIETSVVCSIATKPTQFKSILEWSKQIASDRIVPFPSVHPDDPDVLDHIEMIRHEGFQGVKLHPYYQDFYMDEDRLFPIYSKIMECGLLLVCHTGFDVGHPRVRRADPPMIIRVLERCPQLKLITTHLGAWSDWELVESHLIGRPIYMEISFALTDLPPGEAERLIRLHPPEYLLFGTDSPWQGQSQSVDSIRALGLSRPIEEGILYRNAARLLGRAC